MNTRRSTSPNTAHSKRPEMSKSTIRRKLVFIIALTILCAALIASIIILTVIIVRRRQQQQQPGVSVETLKDDNSYLEKSYFNAAAYRVRTEHSKVAFLPMTSHVLLCVFRENAFPGLFN